MVQPTQEQLNGLIQLYQSNKLEEAEAEAQKLLKQFPAVQKELTIIAQRRIIRELELANQNLIKQKANIKEVKVS